MRRDKPVWGKDAALLMLWGTGSGGSGLAMAARQIALTVAARHGLVFHRTDGDGFRFDKLGKELAELPRSTRQQNAGDTS